MRAFSDHLRCRCPVADRPPAFSAALIYRRRWYPVPQFFTDLQQQVEIFKQRTVIKPFGQTFHFQRVTEQFLILFKTDERVLTAEVLTSSSLILSIWRAREVVPREISRRWR